MGSQTRLNKNINGYFGERIDIGAVLADCLASARKHGWSIEELPVTPGLSLLALKRVAASADPAARRCRVYISAGIHGDEPASPPAVRQLLEENLWPSDLDIWLCPCLNPTGVALGKRENAAGVDLNRQYRNPSAPETLAHTAWLQIQPAFDLCLCLHEDWESNGFYVYEQDPEDRPSLAEAIVARVAEVCPLEQAPLIEGRPARGGIIRPVIDPCSRPDWPESFYLITYKTRLSYTLEAPSDFPMRTRVSALVTAVNTALGLMGSGKDNRE